MLLQAFSGIAPEINSASVFPPNEWITHEALMPRPPADSRVRIDVRAVFKRQPVDADHPVNRRINGESNNQV